VPMLELEKIRLCLPLTSKRRFWRQLGCNLLIQWTTSVTMVLVEPVTRLAISANDVLATELMPPPGQAFNHIEYLWRYGGIGQAVQRG
jgi:hypothetical protein